MLDTLEVTSVLFILGLLLCLNEAKASSLDNTYQNFKNELNKDVPEVIVLKTNLTLEESQYWEDYYCHFYRNHGYFTINTGATGIGVSSAGGVIKKWTYDACYQEALLCKSRVEMKREHSQAYKAALHNKWLDDYYWFVPAFTWTMDMFLELAKKYNDYTTFKKNEKRAYSTIKARKLTGYFREYFEQKSKIITLF